MTTVYEQHQVLQFDSTWKVLKWDTAPEFVGSMRSAFSNLSVTNPRGVKAADVVAARRGRGLTPLMLIAELKDFDHPDVPIAQQKAVAQQATSNEVMRDIIAKVIDSLCGATFAHDAVGGRCDELAAFQSALGKSTCRLLILYCVEIPKPVAALAWNTALKQRLRWLGPRTTVIVTNRSTFTGNGIAYSISRP